MTRTFKMLIYSSKLPECFPRPEKPYSVNIAGIFNRITTKT